MIKDWHRFEVLEQFGYRDALSAFAETDPFESLLSQPGASAEKTWSQELLNTSSNPLPQPQDSPKTEGNQNNATSKQIIRVQEWEKEMYTARDVLRKAWAQIEQSGEAGKWLKDVGRGGIDEWVDLMRKVLKFAEEMGEKEMEGRARL